MQRLEEKLGLPPLSRVAESLNRFPDAKQLKTIREVLLIAERMSQTSLELDKIVMLIGEINSMPLDKLERLDKVLGRIERIIKHAPEDLLGFLVTLKGE